MPKKEGSGDRRKAKSASKSIVPSPKRSPQKRDKKLASFVVQGQVRASDGAPQPGLIVKAFDRNVGVDDRLLGQAITDAKGNYSISYTTRRLGKKSAPDLVVTLYQGDKLLQTADVIFNAPPKVTKDFLIAPDQTPEFQRLSDKILPLLRTTIGTGGLPQVQIKFLGQKLGVDAQEVDRLAQSHTLARGDQTLATFYYGLLSQDLPTDPEALLGRPRASIQTALERAAIFNQIPRLQPEEIDTILNTTLPKLRAENLLKPAPAGQQASLGDLLKIMPEPLSDDCKTKVAEMVARNGIHYRQLPDQLKAAGFTQEQSSGIERTLRLADVTSSHPPLMQHLQQMTAADPDGSLKSLTALGRDEWIDKAYAFGVPAGVNQTPEQYAKQLEAAVETFHPTAMLAARLNSGDLVITRSGFEKAGPFLNNNPDLDIVYTNLPAYTAKANFSGVENKDQLVTSLLKLQRIKRLSASWDEAGALLNSGFESALDLVRAGQNRVIQSLSSGIAPERASYLYERARKVHDVSIVLMSGLLPRFSPTRIAAMGDAPRAQDVSEARTYEAAISQINYPTLQSLFGPLDNSACDFDESVLSPAAYFVDLLQFLNPKAGGGTRDSSHLKALLERRPDLVDLQLSSDNTEIELPHIDLVLEILENAVALPVTLTLPEGTNGNAELSKNPLQKVITDQLQQTSLATIGSNLKATRESSEQGRLTRDTSDVWIVSDKQRRWSLYNSQESLILQFCNPINSINFSTRDVARFINELNQANISSRTKEQIETQFPSENRKSRFLFISDFYISTITPEKQWSMGCCLGVKVLIGPEMDHEGATLTLQTPSDKNVFGPKIYSLETIKPIIYGLKEGVISGLLRYFLPPELKYVMTQITDRSWSISLSEAASAVVSYQPDQLKIAALTYQTKGSSDDLIACPENQNPIAYEILRNPEAYGKAIFPWSLPFNLPWESVRACLDRAGISRRQLIEAALPGQYLSDTRWAYETLGISSEDAALITKSISDQPSLLYSYWGLKPGTGNDWKNCSVYDAEAGKIQSGPSESGDPLSLLSKVSILIQQARISYDDMLRILETYYVFGASTKLYTVILNQQVSDRGPCNLFISSAPQKDTNDRTAPPPGLTPDHLDRMHRLIRLWRKLGWEIEDVDRAINVLDGQAGISEGLLSSLSYIRKLQESLDVPASLLINWWGDLLSYTRSNVTSLYEQIFLNPLVQNPPDDAFLLNPERTALLNSGSVSLSQKSRPIAAALGIGLNDFNQLLGLSGVADTLTLPNLFEIYRIAGLARALGVSISDYFSMVSLTAATPFKSLPALVEFCQAARFILNSGFGIQELSYLLQQDASAALMLDLSADRVSQMLKSIRSAMQAKLSTLDAQVRNIIADNSGGPTVIRVLSDSDGVAADAASLAIEFSPGDSASAVTRPLKLPLSGANRTTIAWAISNVNPSSNASVITIPQPAPGAPNPSVSATVSRPPVNDADTTVTLTATIKRSNPSGTAHATQYFDLVVLKELTDQQAVVADAASLAIEFSPGDSASAVTRPLKLPLSGANRTTIAWAISNVNPSSNASVITIPQPAPGTDSVIATVSRPPVNDADTTVTLTATISSGNPANTAHATKSFDVVVLKELTDEQAVAADAASLAIGLELGDSGSCVTRPLTLRTRGANGTSIQWYSSGDVITIPQPAPGAPTSPDPVIATVSRPPANDSDAHVVLTAVVTKNNVSATRVFYPEAVLTMDHLDPQRLAVVLTLTDPNDPEGLNMHGLLSDVVTGQVAEAFGLEIPAARNLLITRSLFARAILKRPSDLRHDAIEVFFDENFVKKDGADTQDACDLLRLLQKVSLLLSRLKVKAAEIDWISPPFGMLTLDFNKLPLTGVSNNPDLLRSWQKLVTLFQIRDRIQGIGSLLDQYVTELANLQKPEFPWKPKPPIVPVRPPIGNVPIDPAIGNFPPLKPPAPDKLSVLAALIGAALGLSKEWDYAKIAAQPEIKELDDYRNPFELEELINLFGAMKKLGATMDDVNLLTQDWAKPDPSRTIQDPATQAEITARALLRAKYGADSWNDVIKPISDALRTKQRDVLVDYLIHTLSNNGNNGQGIRIRDTNDLYEHLLIDTQMSAHMLTGRLVQATAAVQLFVQRCLLNLETATLNENDRLRWKWMKNYRVWQANREVFLFPENWLFPELRDDKTETFKALESGINQGEPKDQLAKENFLNYLDELNEISKITVYGMYECIDNADSKKPRMLYIVGRSPNQPYNYYWRQCTSFGDIDNMIWSGWEQINDITDDHAMPFVMDSDLHIAWPTITQKTEVTDSGNPDTKKSYWEIKLNWIRRTSKGWTKKKVSKVLLTIPCNSVLNDSTKELSFMVTDDGHSIYFLVYNTALKYTRPSGFTTSLDMNAYPTELENSGNDPYPCPGLPALPYQGYATIYLDSLQSARTAFSWPAAEFRVDTYIDYVKSNGDHVWYGPDAQLGKNKGGSGITFSYCLQDWPTQTLWESYDKIILNPDSGATASFTSLLNWTEFEFFWSLKHPGAIPYLSRIEISYTGSKGKKESTTIYEFAFDANTDTPKVVMNFYQNIVTRSIVVQPTSIVTLSKGALKLDAFGDISLEQETTYWYPLPKGAAMLYANGYISSGNGLELETGGRTIVAREITQQGFVVPAAGSSARYFEYPAMTTPTGNLPPIKAYIDPDNANGQQASWLDVRDNIRDVAKLRATAYSQFETLFEMQTPFELGNNLYLGSEGFAGDGTLGIATTGFDPQAPIALYNWELFYHAPMLMAEFLTKQQRFEDAQKWLHYIFNPTKPDYSGPCIGEAARFWHFLPFRQEINPDNLQELFNLLAEQAATGSIDPSKQAELAQFTGLIDDWRDNPFLPFLVARVPIRWQSFQWRTIFAYLDNLIAWGDQMFRRANRESINEAIQYYVLASKLLGPRPKSVKSQSRPPAQSYRDLYGKWDDFSNAWYTFSDTVSMMLMVSPFQKPGGKRDNADDILSRDIPKLEPTLSPSEPVVALSSLPMLYFGIPNNDKLMKYWDMVEDRLFKIRNCMDIDGVARKWPLFSPRIDPGLLVRATAAGLDIDTVLADMNAPLLPYRFNIIVQKANEICGEVKSLGSALLAALEKKDAEDLALLRSSQEVALLNLVTQVKQRQVDEAAANIDSLNQSMAVAMARFTQYQKLLGKAVSVDSSSLPVLSAGSSLQVSANAPGDESGLGLTQYEVDQIGSLVMANNFMITAGVFNMLSGLMHLLPDNIIGLGQQVKWGGSHLGSAAGGVAALFNMLSGNANHEANKKGMFASYQRRQDEWVFQSKLALEEMKQINKQIIANRIRLDIARKELDNHLKQIDNARVVDEFMHDKYTNRELYSWMTGGISAVYFASYQLAYDMAKRAERAFQSEMGLDNSNFIQFGYWDSLKKGLLAGENLSLDLKRLEIAYLEQNRREFEISKHLSLLQLDPLALINLKETGTCEVSIPEALFDIDFPGHYFRRIKSVSITIPCVAGPYTSVSCTLRLMKHSYRKTAQVGADGYPRKVNSGGIPADDSRFADSFGTIQSIATSHGQNDSGMFELNFRDERYLPFEGAGAISTWRIELPKKFRQFDYDTISDAIIHLKYTAREGGELLGQKATENLKKALNEIISSSRETGLARLFSLRHEFPSEWQRFIREKSVDLKVEKDRLPFFAQSAKFNGFKFVAKDDLSDKGMQVRKTKATGTAGDPVNVTWSQVSDNIYQGTLPNTFTVSFDESLTLSASNTDDVRELYMLVGYKLTET